MWEERARSPPPSFLSSPRSPGFIRDVCIGVRGVRGSLKCPSVPYLPQPFSQSFPNACIIFSAEILLLPRAPPSSRSRLNILRSSALGPTCRGHAKRGCRLRLRAGRTGKCSSLPPSDPGEHPESPSGDGPFSTLGLHLWLQPARVE